MPLTAQELANAAAAAIDFHMREQPNSQTIQDRPVYEKLIGKQKSFPGGNNRITVPVKGVYGSSFQGYSDDDQLAFSNRANAKRASYRWVEVHDGLTLPYSELKLNGISVTDTMDSSSTKKVEDRERIALHDMLADKIEDYKEGFERAMNNMFWLDGSQDPKVSPGIQAFVLKVAPASQTGVTGGIDRSLNAWWRNRAVLAIASNSGTWANQPLVQTLQKEMRQLRRYGGRPDLFVVGSDFLDAFEMELRAKGNYTLEGWSKKGKIDASVADVMFKGLDLIYDPTLDDLGEAKSGYVLDTSKLFPMVMSGEDRRQHVPARPYDRFVMHRSITWTGGFVAKQLNCHGVYTIA
jgi:hypothetical protein